MADSLEKLDGSKEKETLEPGARVEGIIISIGDEGALVEIGSKQHGIIERSELEGLELCPGESVTAHFVRVDSKQELAILSLAETRREIFWDQLSAGDLLEGQVTGVNKGGLTVDIAGEKAFLPISQIELSRVDDLSGYVGMQITCEVMSFDRGERDVVVSRRGILEREREAGRVHAVAGLEEGQIVSGRVTRITAHGAFIDLGGVDGLLPQNKIQRRQKSMGGNAPLKEGETVQLEIVHLDREAGRVSLDFQAIGVDGWSQVPEEYQVEDTATGLVTRIDAEGAWVLIDEGVEGVIPTVLLAGTKQPIEAGALCRTVIVSIDLSARRIELKPI